MAHSNSQVSTRQVLGWIGSHLSKYALKTVGAIVALFVAAGAWLMLGQGIKYAIDSGFIAASTDELNTATTMILAVTFVACVATYIRFYLMSWLGERVSADIRSQVFSHLLSLPPSFFAELRTGEVISRFTSDTTIIQTVVGMSLSMTLRSFVTFIGALILMGIASPILTLCVLIAVPAVLIPIKVLAPKVRKFAKASQDSVADIGAHIDQSLHEIMTVQAYNAEDTERTQFNQNVENTMSVAAKRIHYRSLLIGCIMLLSMASITLIFWVGARQVLSGSLTVGELSAFLFYAIMAGSSVATISEVIGEVQRGVGASERLFELLNTAPDISDDGEVSANTAINAPSVHFDHVSFGYDESNLLFDDMTLDIPAGETIALVGPSGAGKSTIFQLLMRFYNTSKGQIRFNNVDIAEMPLDLLRKHIAIVTQEPVIFATSVIDNIRYGTPNATEADIIEAAKLAYAHDFIEKLSDGYHTQLGERGVKLSGGQKQRIAIARAILANRPILLLDEATSALDAMSENMVQKAMNTLMEGKTCIVIAHRLATVKHVDNIVVMESGKVVAVGTHSELMKSDTLYREYAELQLLS